MPIVKAVGLDPIWFGLLALINTERGMKTPPFGLCLFAMKGVVPVSVSMADIFRSVTPFVLLDMIAMTIIMFFPSIATVLPALMRH